MYDWYIVYDLVYFKEAQKEGQMSAKGGQKEGFPGQRPKSRAKEGHGRAPSQKQGSLAAMALTHAYPKISKTVTHSGCLDWGLELQTL